MQYSDMFKNTMIQKMTGTDALSATALSKQIGVPQTTLSKWLKNAGIATPFGYSNIATEYASMTKIKKPLRPKDWKPENKFKFVMEAASLDDEQLGEFLRKNGLHQTHLEQWRLQMLGALQNGGPREAAKKSKADAKKIKALEKELKRKEKALAETAALLVLKKKLQEIWGDEDDAMNRSNEK